MNAPLGEWRIANAAWPRAKAALSVLTPFKGDDPTGLIERLGRDDIGAELVLLDDGGGDDALAGRVAAAVMAAAAPALFVRRSANLGRAKARNCLADQARGGHLLFLDADMRPDSLDFLARWLQIAREDDPAVAFGGFTLDQTPARREHAVHRAMALKGDCIPAARRCLAPEKHVFTSNLLVRADVFADDPFDEAFAGWGWEDVEWAMRVSRRRSILHVENTASHLGLDTAPAIAAKFEQSPANFARVAALHGDILAAYPSFRAAKLLARAPMRARWRPAVKALALAEGAPVRLRAAAMRLYRAALYAEVI
jgi:glycosyltransferase involved in cell wall biosynthesis